VKLIITHDHCVPIWIFSQAAFCSLIYRNNPIHTDFKTKLQKCNYGVSIGNNVEYIWSVWIYVLIPCNYCWRYQSQSRKFSLCVDYFRNLRSICIWKIHKANLKGAAICYLWYYIILIKSLHTVFHYLNKTI